MHLVNVMRHSRLVTLKVFAHRTVHGRNWTMFELDRLSKAWWQEVCKTSFRWSLQIIIVSHVRITM